MLRLKRLITEVKILNTKFDRRFLDFKKLDGVNLCSIYSVISGIEVEATEKKISFLFEMNIEKVKMGIIQLQSDIFIKSRAFEENI